MTVGDSPVGVTICKRGRQGLYADDYGVTVRNWHGSELRFAWSEISRFADGSRTGEDVQWVLLIVLHTGRTIDVGCTLARPTPEMLDAVRHVAARYEIPADLTGVPTEKDGRPAERGLYEDPSGRPGLRYWDGGRWSPLVPLDIGKSESVRKSAGSWSALPVADGSWTYAAARARFYAAVATVGALGSAGLLVGLYSSRDSGVGVPLSFGAFAALYVLMTRWAWIERKFFLKLNEGAHRARGNGRDRDADNGGDRDELVIASWRIRGRSRPAAGWCGRGELMVKFWRRRVQQDTHNAQPAHNARPAPGQADLAAWAREADVSRLSSQTVREAEDYLNKYRHMNLELSQQMGWRVMAAIEAQVTPSPPPFAQPLDVIATVLALWRKQPGTGLSSLSARSCRDRDVDDRHVEQCHEES